MAPDADVPARFEAHIAPVREALTRLLDASEELPGRWGSLPDANSRAMAELAGEHQFKGTEPWGDDPVQNAHNLAQLLLYGASDCARAAIRLLSTDPTPVYAHVVLARAALEHAGRAWTLIDQAISTRLRVARGMNERLYGLSEQLRLPVPKPVKDQARQRRTALLAAGHQLGFRKVRPNRRTPETFEEERMGQTAVVRALLRTGGDSSLGTLVYAYYSAVAHGTTFGLTQSVSRSAPGAPPTPGVTWGALYTGSQEVVSVLTGMILGLGAAYRARNDLFGWASDEWNHAYSSALQSASQAIKA